MSENFEEMVREAKLAIQESLKNWKPDVMVRQGPRSFVISKSQLENLSYKNRLLKISEELYIDPVPPKKKEKKWWKFW